MGEYRNCRRIAAIYTYMGIEVALLAIVQKKVFALIFGIVFLFAEASYGGNPFVDYSPGGKSTKEGRESPPIPLPPPPTQSAPGLNEAAKQEKKDIELLGMIGRRVAVSVNGKISTVRDGAEIEECIIVYPQILCSARAKENYAKSLKSSKTREEDASCPEKVR